MYSYPCIDRTWFAGGRGEERSGAEGRGGERRGEEGEERRGEERRGGEDRKGSQASLPPSPEESTPSSPGNP